jgi:hypothetical protein
MEIEESLKIFDAVRQQTFTCTTQHPGQSNPGLLAVRKAQLRDKPDN